MIKNVTSRRRGSRRRDRNRPSKCGYRRLGCWAVAAAALVAALGTGVGAARPAGPVSASSTDPVASTGCRAAATLPGESTLRFAAVGKSGTYLQDVPRAARRPMPVVFDLHGYLEPAQIEHLQTGLGRFGDGHGFVTITPQIDEPGLPRWDFAPGSADISYLAHLLTHVESSVCVDERRVYMTGLSMGAFTTSSIACQLADRVAAVAPVAGLQDFSWCRPARPVPVVAFHGTADPFVAYNGGPGPIGRMLPAPDGPLDIGSAAIPTQVAGWAKRNGCGRNPARRHVAADVTLLTYPCGRDSTVEFYSIACGGHTWPGSTSGVSPAPLVGATTTSIDANQIIWDFFRSHPLSRVQQ